MCSTPTNLYELQTEMQQNQQSTFSSITVCCIRLRKRRRFFSSFELMEYIRSCVTECRSNHRYNTYSIRCTIARVCHTKIYYYKNFCVCVTKRVAFHMATYNNSILLIQCQCDGIQTIDLKNYNASITIDIFERCGFFCCCSDAVVECIIASCLIGPFYLYFFIFSNDSLRNW